MARIEKVAKDACQIEIYEARTVAEQELAMREHLLKRQQAFGELCLHFLLLRSPLVNAAATELSLFVADERELILALHELAVINIVELESQTFDLVFDVTPENRLFAFEIGGEKAELEFLIEILANDLGIVARFKNDVSSVADDRRCVVTFLGELPNEGTITSEFEVGEFELRAGKFENTPLHDAEGAPRKLNQLDHCKTSSPELWRQGGA